MSSFDSSWDLSSLRPVSVCIDNHAPARPWWTMSVTTCRLLFGSMMTSPTLSWLACFVTVVSALFFFNSGPSVPLRDFSSSAAAGRYR